MSRHLNVFVLTVAPPGRRAFYSEPVRAAGDAGRAPSTRLGRLYRSIRARWRRSEGGAARAGRRAWDWLHARTHPDEPLYARLRNARGLTIRHPASMDPADVLAEWSAFLRAGTRRHIPWLILNVLIAPLTLVIALLPGPNLIGYWFVYRAFHHLFILIGLARARMGRLPTHPIPVPELDRPIDAAADPAGEADRLALAGLVRRPHKLAIFLRRHGVAGNPALTT